MIWFDNKKTTPHYLVIATIIYFTIKEIAGQACIYHVMRRGFVID